MAPDSASLSQNRDPFLALLGLYAVKLVLAGHEHQDLVAQDPDYPSVPFVQTGAALDGAYRVIHVAGSSVTVDPAQRFAVATPPLAPIPFGPAVGSVDVPTAATLAWQNTLPCLPVDSYYAAVYTASPFAPAWETTTADTSASVPAGMLQPATDYLWYAAVHNALGYGPLGGGWAFRTAAK